MVVKWLEGEVQKAVLKMSSEERLVSRRLKNSRTVQLLQTPPRRPTRLTSRDELHLHLL